MVSVSESEYLHEFECDRDLSHDVTPAGVSVTLLVCVPVLRPSLVFTHLQRGEVQSWGQQRHEAHSVRAILNYFQIIIVMPARLWATAEMENVIFSPEISNFSVDANYIPGNCVSLPLDTVVDFGNDSLYLARLLRQAAIAQTRGVKSREEIVLSFVLLHCLQSGYHI